MKTLRKVFLYISLFTFVMSFVIFKINIDVWMFILGLGFILLGVSSIFEMIVVEKEQNSISFGIRKLVIVSFLCGLALCLCFFCDT